LKIVDGTKMDLPVSSLEPNKFNPNVMSPEEMESLKQDMKRSGPKHELRIDDLVVSPKNIFYNNPDFPSDIYVIVDGEHRWKNAVELEWPTIPCVIRMMGEQMARWYNYRKNKERGHLDPIKEAELFKSEIDQGFKQDQIARGYNISRSYVASRLGLIQLDEKVKEMHQKPEEVYKKDKLAEFQEAHNEWEQETEDESTYVQYSEPEEPTEEELVPRGTISPSHLEAISSLPQEHQVKLAKEILDQDLTVRTTERRVKQIKKDLAEQKRFREALEKAKRPKCPKCGSAPKGFSYQGEHLFTCSSAMCYTVWEYMKTQEEVDAERKAEKEKRKSEADQDRIDKMKKGRENPRFIRTKETPEELHALTAPWILQKVLQFTEVSSVNISGKRGDENILLQYTPAGSYNRMDLTYIVRKDGDEKRFGFGVQEKDYKKFDAKSRVDMDFGMEPSDETREQLAKFFREIAKTNKDPWGQ
jgi:ParB/RepB/Spo0J family partition protein